MMTPTTRAGIVHNAAAERARRLFAGIDGLEVCEQLGFFKLYVGDTVVVRLKRVRPQDDGFVACNIKTKQQKRYYRHEPVDGVRDGATRLSVGYVLDETETRITQVVASLQYGLKRCIYWFTLDAAAGDLPIITPVPLPPLPPDGKPVVRPKRAEKAEGE